ncbi:DUF4962 domain-containing protein [Aestuariivivens insulae]|uniref:DUF4962 domain-containing protein n=1 Tax=Aestuariivivens insulae TaxID=1621988 RepID=UPI001F598C96|nr:DUF4962 domain-containing protein [Aestuariivivens insulae]
MKKYLIVLVCLLIQTNSFCQDINAVSANRSESMGLISIDSLPEALYEEWRISEYPKSKSSVLTNPSPLLWASEKYWKKKDVKYKVYLSMDEKFTKDETITSEALRTCFFNPHYKLKAGKWFWKYDIIEERSITSKGVFSFIVDPETKVFETPTFDELLSKVPKNHPRVMNQGKNLGTLRVKAKAHPLYKKIIEIGYKTLHRDIYRGAVADSNPAKDRALSKIAGKEIKYYQSLLEAYVLSGDQAILDNLIQRTEVFLGWPTDDLLGSKVLTSLAVGYDVLFSELSETMKQKLLKVIQKQLIHGLKSWPGLIEGRQVENHFWQMELAGNFAAALATVGDLKESEEMLKYTYELYVARFPNLATQDGGWAEGLGYFRVNKTAIVDMPLLLKKVCGVDMFKMDWFKNLADYFTYFAPIDEAISGFGDMHDRVKNGNIGHDMMMVIGHENNDERTLYRLASLLKAEKPKNADSSWLASELSEMEPWYQIINDIYFEPDKIAQPKDYSQDKLFKGVGLVAFHNDILNRKNNAAVYFRSSPFGAKGHMHANQNCFNITRKGEPIFYSTGYYTTFADPHSLTSYRHTRAHNGILVNDMGQAFGHEGYGWIKRYINGERISYVCGDATQAYRPIVDKQFIKLNKDNGIELTPEFGFGDAKLKSFERHLIFIRPNTVVVYDVLESKEAMDWTFLLHTLEKPEFDINGYLKLKTGKSNVEALVVGGTDLKKSITDKFYSPAIDIKKKYNGLPNQFHVSYKTNKKSKKMRYLAIVQMGDKNSEISKVSIENDSVFKFSNIVLKAELDINKAPFLSVLSDQDSFYINKENENTSVLIEENSNGRKELRSTNMLPEF